MCSTFSTILHVKKGVLHVVGFFWKNWIIFWEKLIFMLNLMKWCKKLRWRKIKDNNNTAGMLPREIKMYFIRNSNFDQTRCIENKCNEVAVIFVGQDGKRLTWYMHLFKTWKTYQYIIYQ